MAAAFEPEQAQAEPAQRIASACHSVHKNDYWRDSSRHTIRISARWPVVRQWVPAERVESQAATPRRATCRAPKRSPRLLAEPAAPAGWKVEVGQRLLLASLSAAHERLRRWTGERVAARVVRPRRRRQYETWPAGVQRQLRSWRRTCRWCAFPHRNLCRT